MSRSSESTTDEAAAAGRSEKSGGREASVTAGRPPSSQAPTPVRLGPLGWARFVWRQLTSMRVALLLLLLLAIAAVPGSLFPQRSADPNGVTTYFNDHPVIAPWLDWLGLFNVYASVWFSAIYLLLFISLIGCVTPRIKHHWEALRSKPPKTPFRLERLEAYRRIEVPATPEAVVDAADALLGRARYRRARYDRAARGSSPAGVSVSAERGYARETGNLVFHVALVGVLIAVGVGGGISYHGQRVIVQGSTFANTLSAYDSFSPGQWIGGDQLEPFQITLDKFTTTYADTLSDAKAGSFGQPIDYQTDVTVRQTDGALDQGQIKVNHPLNINGTDVFLLGNGYAPVITVRDAEGQVVFSDPVPFLPQSAATMTSLGVVKVTDTTPQQLGFVGYFYPTAQETQGGTYTSVYPGLDNPLLSLNIYEGDLGVNQGVPKSVYSIDTDSLTQIAGGPGNSVEAIKMKPGETVDLPGGRGTVTFEEVRPYISVELRRDDSQAWVLIFALIATTGLLASLFIPRRRVWVAASPSGDGGTTIVEIAGLARGDDHTLGQAVERLTEKLSDQLGSDTPGADDATASEASGTTTSEASGVSADEEGQRKTQR